MCLIDENSIPKPIMTQRWHIAQKSDSLSELNFVVPDKFFLELSVFLAHLDIVVFVYVVQKKFFQFFFHLCDQISNFLIVAT